MIDYQSLKDYRREHSTLTLTEVPLELIGLIDSLRFKEVNIIIKAGLLADETLVKRFLGYNFNFILTDFFGLMGIAGILNLKRNSQRIKLKYAIKHINDFDKLERFCNKVNVKNLILKIDMPLETCFLRLKEFAKKFKIEFENYKRELSILLNDMQEGPILVQFEVTNKCNHQCVFCYHHSPLLLDRDDEYFKTHKFNPELVKRPKEWHNQMLDYNFFKRYVKEIKATNCKYIQLGGGGEPFTHPDIMKMLRLLKKNGFTVQVFTNFTLMDKARLKEIISLGVDVLEVNISAATPETYARIHHTGKSTFLKLIKDLKYVSKFKRPEIRIMNPINSWNYKEIPEMVKLAEDVGASAVYFGHLQTTELTDFLLLNSRQVKEVYNMVVNAKTKLNNNFDYYLQVLNYKGTLQGSHTQQIFNRVGCLISFYEIQIHLDGSIAPCCLHPPIFKINGRSFKEVWNSPEYKAYRKKVLNLYRHKEKKYLCRGCRMCVYQEDIQRFYNDLGKLTKFLR